MAATIESMVEAMRDIASLTFSDSESWVILQGLLETIRDVANNALGDAGADRVEEDPDGDEDEDEDAPPTEPEEGDLITSDYLKFFCSFAPRGPVVVVPEPPMGEAPDWVPHVEAYMDEVKFWSNVWYQGERGDFSLLDMETGGFAKS